jgi:small-conductance mechanosensitive channel
MNSAFDWQQAIRLMLTPWAALLQDDSWLGAIVELLLGALAVMLFHGIGTRILDNLAAPFPFSRRLVRYGNHAGGMAVFFLVSQLILRSRPSTLIALDAVQHLNAIAMIAALTWLAARCVKAVGDTIIELHPADTPDNLHARRIQTQTKVLTRTAMTLMAVIGSGLALMTLPLLRQIGSSLLASAGLAGIVVGFAARPVLSNLLAGIQLALTQPIRLDDAVFVENEWGWVEEITGAYVVIRLWDQRRLILPLQWFIEHPFQNWTRNASDILGTVLLWVDYGMPVEALRGEAERICASAPEWDRRVCVIHVVETSEHAMQVRVLVSAGDASRAWDLRCRMREGLIDFIQRDYPGFLPRVRAHVDIRTTAGTAPE